MAAKYARANGCKVILDMGGQNTPLSRELLENVDIVSPNNTELDRIAIDFNGTLDEKVNHVMSLYPGLDMLFKEGSKGPSYFSNKNTNYMDAEMKNETSGMLYEAIGWPAYSFADYEGRAELVDTTGAGDCFTAAFAVGQLQGYDTERSMDFACKSAFLCVSKMGAGPAMPLREEVDSFFS